MSVKDDKAKVEELVEQTQIQQVAGLALLGASEHAIAKQLNVNRYRIRKLMASTEFKEHMHGLSSKAVELAVAAFKAKMNSLEPLAFAALKGALEDGKIEAVKVWAGMVGLDKVDEDKAQAPITIVMPGAQPQEAPAIQVNVEAPKDASDAADDNPH